MRTTRRFTPCIAFLLAATACADPAPFEPGADLLLEPAFAGIPGVEFTASDAATALLDPGTVRVADGLVIIRGLKVQYRWDGSDPRITGLGVITANGNLSALDGTGPVWGEVNEFVSDQGDEWFGHWQGHRRQNGSQWFAELSFLMGGRAPNGDKLIAKGINEVTTFTLQPSGYVGQVSGTIHSPGQ